MDVCKLYACLIYAYIIYYEKPNKQFARERESLHKDTMAKNCSRSRKRTETMMEAGSNFCLIN
jgi:hypothetical protein